MQLDRRLKLESTLLVALFAAGAGNGWAQTTVLRAPVSSLANPRPGALLDPAAGPASSPPPGSLHNTSPLLQAPKTLQAPLSQAPILPPRSYGAPPAQSAQPQVNVRDGRKILKIALPQRTQCLPEIVRTTLSQKGPGSITLVCNVPDQPTPMDFVYPNEQLIKTVYAADKSGFSLQIDYDDQTPVAEGNPPRQLVIVGAQEAYLSRVHVVCLPMGNRNQLQVGPRNGQAYPQFTTFCTDGQRVTPVTFASDQNSWNLLYSAVEDGPLAIDYHLIMGGRHPKTGVVRPYPVQRITKLQPFPPPGNWIYDTKHPGDPALAGMAARCGSSHVGGAGAASCFGSTLPVKVVGMSKGLENSGTEYRTFFTDAIARAQNVPVPQGSSSTKSVTYTLMPGVVPAEFRSATGGACRVALYSAVEFRENGRIGGNAGRAEHPKDAYCRKLYASDAAIWGYSEVRNQEMCFSSRAQLEADQQSAAAKSSAEQAKYYKPSPPPPPPAIDTCELLPR